MNRITIVIHGLDVFTYNGDVMLKINEEEKYVFSGVSSISIYIRGLKNALRTTNLSTYMFVIFYACDSQVAASIAKKMSEEHSNNIVIFPIAEQIKQLVNTLNNGEIWNICGERYVLQFTINGELVLDKTNELAYKQIISPLQLYQSVFHANAFMTNPQPQVHNTQNSPEHEVIIEWSKMKNSQKGRLDDIYVMMGIEKKNEQSHRRLIVSLCCALILKRMSSTQRQMIKSTAECLNHSDKYIADSFIYKLLRVYSDKANELRKEIADDYIYHLLIDLLVVDELNDQSVIERIRNLIITEKIDDIWLNWRKQHE